MEVWQYLDILRKSDTTWFFGEKNQDEKLLALKKLAKIGYPSIIEDLIPLLKHDSEKIRNDAIQTIKTLFEKLNNKKAYYESLKGCFISTEDIDYYHRNFNELEFILLMKISSLNRNGYVREEAVRRLGISNDETVLAFIIFRLADWVPNVRQEAKQKLRKFFKPTSHTGLVNNLSLFEWLQKVERTDLSGIYREVIEFLTTENRKQTIQQFNEISDKERRILAKELSKEIRSEEELNLYLNDKHFLIRLLALNHFDRLSEAQKGKLLRDKSARIRQSTLYCYQGSLKFKELLPKYLADKSGSIRHLARFHLKNDNIDFKEFYINNLIHENQVLGSILGLLDIEAKDCKKYIEPYLESEKAKIVKTAFYVLSALNSGEMYEFAKENLFTNQVGLRNSIIDFFEKNSTKEILEIARNKYGEANKDMKLSILKLFSRIGGYSILSDLLIGTIDDNEAIRHQTRLHLQKWKREAVTMFSKPNQEERNRAMKVFKYVSEIHNEKEYFNSNPVEGLDFYIK